MPDDPLRKAIDDAIEALGTWLTDQVPSDENWEDAEPEIDGIRAALIDALQKHP